MVVSEAVILEQVDEHRLGLRLAAQFREAGEYIGNWPAERCAQRLAELCTAAGGALFPMMLHHRSVLPDMPSFLLALQAGPRDDNDGAEEQALWWLALVGWLEDCGRLTPVRECGVSFHREVFRMWRPNMQFHKHPFLSFHVGVCKAYGAGACRQSAAAIRCLFDVIGGSNGAARPAATCGTLGAVCGAPAAQFVGSRFSEYYHHLDCPMARNISPQNLVNYDGPPVGKQLHDGCGGPAHGQ